MDGKDTDSIYLDYAKAFDKVDHTLLVKKLHKYGVHPKLIKWIESFLSDRTQNVVVDATVTCHHLPILSAEFPRVLFSALYSS
jgi:hypothetical protein